MKKTICAVALALALALPLAGCSSSTSSTTDDSTDDTATEEEASDETTDDATEDTASDDDFDAVYFFSGQWRGSVETTGETVYGNVAGTESMLDVYVYEDGTCEVIPLEAHADLFTDTGTWEATESEITLTFSDRTIVLTVTSDTSLTGDPTDFDIDGFDEINFVLY